MEQTLNIVFAAVVALATTAYAVLTVLIVRETIRLRQAQTEPEAVLYLQPGLRSPHFIDIIVRNIGPGTAYNLSWAFDRASPLIAERGVELPKMRFFQGVRYFAPSQEYRSFFASSIDLLREPVPPPLEITLTFENRGGSRYDRSFIIDVRELSSRTWVGDEPIIGIAEGITKIQKHIDNLMSGWRKAQVDTYDSTDRAEEAEALQQRLAAARAASEKGTPVPSGGVSQSEGPESAA